MLVNLIERVLKKHINILAMEIKVTIYKSSLSDIQFIQGNVSTLPRFD